MGGQLQIQEASGLKLCLKPAGGAIAEQAVGEGTGVVTRFALVG